jgi:hypothetical protein
VLPKECKKLGFNAVPFETIAKLGWSSPLADWSGTEKKMQKLVPFFLRGQREVNWVGIGKISYELLTISFCTGVHYHSSNCDSLS